MMGQVHGKIDLEAKGGKLYGFINALRKHGVLCQNQRCCGDVFYCRTETREKQLLEELAKQYHVTLQLHERQTLRFWLVRNRFRFGIPIGLLLAAAFLFYTSNVVMKIEIQGNQTVTEEEILTVLAQEGVERGSWMPSLRYAHCERQLQIKLSPLCWAAMRNREAGDVPGSSAVQFGRCKACTNCGFVHSGWAGDAIDRRRCAGRRIVGQRHSCR